MSQPWWRSAVFYQVYVRSFADSNDDGVGDLPGITSRLGYLKELGVDALWLAPFYTSQPHSRPLPLRGLETGRVAAEQLDVFVRRAGVVTRAGRRRLVSPSLRARAARSELVEPRGAQGIRTHPEVLAGPGRRRLSDRRGLRPVPAAGCRRPACHPRPGLRSSTAGLGLRDRRPAPAPRRLPRLAPFGQRLRARPRARRRDLRAEAAREIHPPGPAPHGVRPDPSAVGRSALAALDRGEPRRAAGARHGADLDACQPRRGPSRVAARGRRRGSGPRPGRAGAASWAAARALLR